MFDPNKPGPLTIITDSHKDNPDYLENRAIELIMETRYLIKECGNDIDIHNEKISKAISLLGLAILIRNIKCNNE